MQSVIFNVIIIPINIGEKVCKYFPTLPTLFFAKVFNVTVNVGEEACKYSSYFPYHLLLYKIFATTLECSRESKYY